LLDRHKVPRERVFIFVADMAERERYAAELGACWPNLIIGVPTLWRQRNFITNYFDEGSHVISMDDDVEELYRLVESPHRRTMENSRKPLVRGGLLDIIEDAWRKMHQGEIFLWSLNVSDNPAYMKAGRTVLRVGLCNGYFWGCRNRKDPGLLLRYGDGHEDIERTLRFFSRDGKVLRYREFCAKTRCKGNRGGLQTSMTAAQRAAAEQSSIGQLLREFPLYVVPKEGSKLGMKFCSGLADRLQEESVVPIMLLRDMAAKRQLRKLHGAIWLALRGKRVVKGTVARCVPPKLCLQCADAHGTLLGVDVHDFYSAIRDRLLFIIWMPRDACAEIGIEYREPSEYLLDLSGGPQHGAAACGAEGEQPTAGEGGGGKRRRKKTPEPEPAKRIRQRPACWTGDNRVELC